MFLPLRAEQREALVDGDVESETARDVMRRLRRLVRAMPGSGFVTADTCAPTDSPLFEQSRRVLSGKAAWRMLVTSRKVRAAFEAGESDCLIVRPFRRMDKAREFRMFFHARQLVGMSQYCLIRHFARLAKRVDEIWSKGNELAEHMAPFLPDEDQVADVYLCSDGTLLLVDLNPWGEPTDPKLFRTWDRDWATVAGLKLIPEPTKMKGDVSVSF